MIGSLTRPSPSAADTCRRGSVCSPTTAGCMPYRLSGSARSILHNWPPLLRHSRRTGGSSRTAVEVLIDDFDPQTIVQEPLGSYQEYDLYRFRGPSSPCRGHWGGSTCASTRSGLARGWSRAKVGRWLKRGTAADRSAATVEFAGWLPVFRQFGDCRAHPQFAHTNAPPPGYGLVRAPVMRRWSCPARPGLLRRVMGRAGRLCLALRGACGLCSAVGPRATLCATARDVVCPPSPPSGQALPAAAQHTADGSCRCSTPALAPLFNRS